VRAVAVAAIVDAQPSEVDSGAHPGDGRQSPAVGQGMIGLGHAMFDAVLAASSIEGMTPEPGGGFRSNFLGRSAN
jgi:hypothetical protein